MTDIEQTHTRPRVLGPTEGDISGPVDGTRDRFLLDGHDTAGRVALVEHQLAPGALAAPMHLHTKEDEYSFVLEGQVGAILDGHEVVAGAGHLIFKPRGQWHTFWNAGEARARILEIITPGGLEQLFRHMGTLDSELDPESLAALAAPYGCEVDFEQTMAIVERHGLVL